MATDLNRKCYTCFLVLTILLTNAEDTPCTTYYKWREKYDDQDTWDFDGTWRNKQVDSDCPEMAREECCENEDKCDWIRQAPEQYWNQNRNQLDTKVSCLWDNNTAQKGEGYCVARNYPLGFKPFRLTAFNKDTPCIEVENSRGGIVEILIETDTAARICIADSGSIGNVDRSQGEVLQGHCSSDGRLHACINADTREENTGNVEIPNLKDLKFYVWCDENCMEYDTDMWIRTQKSAVKWDKIANQGTFSAAYYGYAEGECDAGNALCESQQPLYPYYMERGGSHKNCKQWCFQDSKCLAYSWGENKCKLSGKKLDLFSRKCDLRNRKNPITPVPKDGWETRDLLDAATGNVEMWCMYEAGLKAKDCKSMVRFPSDLNNDVPAAYIELFYQASPATTLQTIIPTLLLVFCWIV